MGAWSRRRIAQSAVPFAAGVFFFILSSRMEFGTWQNPGPGLWPTLLSLVIVLASALLLALPARAADDDDERFTRDSRFTLYGIIALALYILLFKRLGLTLPSFGLLLFWTRGLGRERWRVALPVSVLLTAVIYAIFAWGLEVPFPEDKLIHLLGLG